MGVSVDPTMELVRRLEDPAAWDHIDRGICVFREHTAYHFNPATGKNDLKVVYDKAALERFAGRMLELQRGYGVCPRIIGGHTKPKQEKTIAPDGTVTMRSRDEKEQPDLWGVYANPVVEPWGPEGIWAIKMDRFFLPGCYEEGKHYPFRSPEFYPEAYANLFPGEIQPQDIGVITAVAQLKTDPKLDMGMTLYQKSFPLCYARFDWDEPMTDPASMPGVPDANANTEQQNGDAEYDSRFKACMSRCYPKFEKYHQDVMCKYEGMAFAGPGNTMPNDKPEKTTMSATVPTVTLEAPPASTTAAAVPAPAPVDVDALRQMRTQLDAMQAQYERGRAEDKAVIAKLQADLAAEQHSKILAQYERDLTPLLNVWKFDLQKHMARCKDASGVPISRERFDDMVANIKECYERAPVAADHNTPLGTVNGDPIVHSVTPPKTNEPASQIAASDIMPLAQYQLDHPGKSQDECVVDYLKQKAAKKAPVPVAAA